MAQQINFISYLLDQKAARSGCDAVEWVLLVCLAFEAWLSWTRVLLKCFGHQITRRAEGGYELTSTWLFEILMHGSFCLSPTQRVSLTKKIHSQLCFCPSRCNHALVVASEKRKPSWAVQDQYQIFKQRWPDLAELRPPTPFRVHPTHLSWLALHPSPITQPIVFSAAHSAPCSVRSRTGMGSLKMEFGRCLSHTLRATVSSTFPRICGAISLSGQPAHAAAVTEILPKWPAAFREDQGKMLTQRTNDLERRVHVGSLKHWLADSSNILKAESFGAWWQSWAGIRSVCTEVFWETKCKQNIRDLLEAVKKPFQHSLDRLLQTAMCIYQIAKCCRNQHSKPCDQELQARHT